MIPPKFAYRPQRSKEDALILSTIDTGLETETGHLDSNAINPVRALFTDFSSAFNTIKPYDPDRQVGLL